MSSLPNINSASTSNQAFGSANTLNDLDLNAFFNLMITELQNQDPLNPLENNELLAQISQIREVGATEKLTATLDAVLLGQNISSATNLIGADVVALTDSGQRVSGNVRVVTIENGQPKLELAVGTTATAATQEGEIAEGKYTYEVVWESESGVKFGVEVEDVSTASLVNFDGAIRLNNLPETDTPKQVYRTDNTGDGERKLVAELPNGKSTSFVDTVADIARTGDPIASQVQKLEFANRVTVSLNNVGEVRPPQN